MHNKQILRQKYQKLYLKGWFEEKNTTVVVKVCPQNYLFSIPTNFLPQLFDIFTHSATLAAAAARNLGREIQLTRRELFIGAMKKNTFLFA